LLDPYCNQGMINSGVAMRSETFGEHVEVGGPRLPELLGNYEAHLRQGTPQLQHTTVTAQKIYFAFESSAFRSPSATTKHTCAALA
jgi:hypothetical protein